MRTPAAARIATQARLLAADRPIGSDHYLLALASDERSLAGRLLASVGLDPEALEQRLVDMDRAGTSDELAEDVGARRTRLGVSGDAIEVRVEDPAQAAALREALMHRNPSQEPPTLSIGGDDPAASVFPLLWKAVTHAAQDVVGRLGDHGEAITVEIRQFKVARLRAKGRSPQPKEPDDPHARAT